jgi:hypothetical protein
MCSCDRKLDVRVFRHIRKIVKSDCQLRHVCLSVRPFVHISVRIGQHGIHSDSNENLMSVCPYIVDDLKKEIELEATQ